MKLEFKRALRYLFENHWYGAVSLDCTKRTKKKRKYRTDIQRWNHILSHIDPKFM